MSYFQYFPSRWKIIFDFDLSAFSWINAALSYIGLEDNLYLEKGVLAKSNAEYMAKIIRIAGELGIQPATPDEARKISGLKGLDQVAF